jgi:hypothetical protein
MGVLYQACAAGEQRLPVTDEDGPGVLGGITLRSSLVRPQCEQKGTWLQHGRT